MIEYITGPYGWTRRIERPAWGVPYGEVHKQAGGTWYMAMHYIPPGRRVYAIDGNSGVTDSPFDRYGNMRKFVGESQTAADCGLFLRVA